MPVVLKVVFYGTYRLITHCESIELALPASRLLEESRLLVASSTLLAVLHEIIVLYPMLGEALFDAAGNLFPYIPLFLNGRNPRLLEQGLHTIVTQGDVLSIFSPVASGRMNVEDINQSTAGPFPEERLR